MLFVTHAKTGWLGRSCLDLYYHCKHVKNMINHQLLKFTPLRLVSYVAVIYFGPQGQFEQRRGFCPWGFSCLIFFHGHLPQTFSFRSVKQILVVSLATQPRTCVLNDRNIFYTPRGGTTTAGSNAPGAFLVQFVTLWVTADLLITNWCTRHTSNKKCLNWSAHLKKTCPELHKEKGKNCPCEIDAKWPWHRLTLLVENYFEILLSWKFRWILF